LYKLKRGEVFEAVSVRQSSGEVRDRFKESANPNKIVDFLGKIGAYKHKRDVGYLLGGNGQSRVLTFPVEINPELESYFPGDSQKIDRIKEYLGNVGGFLSELPQIERRLESRLSLHPVNHVFDLVKRFRRKLYRVTYGLIPKDTEDLKLDGTDSELANILGLMQYDESRLSLNENTLESDEFELTYFHEAMHLISGEQKVGDQIWRGVAPTKKTALQKSIEKPGYVALNEGLTEYFALTLYLRGRTGSDLEAFNSFNRSGYKVYVECIRSLIQLIDQEYLEEGITLRNLLAGAYFECQIYKKPIRLDFYGEQFRSYRALLNHYLNVIMQTMNVSDRIAHTMGLDFVASNQSFYKDKIDVIGTRKPLKDLVGAIDDAIKAGSIGPLMKFLRGIKI